MKQFKIRASAIGTIMTDPKEANPMQQYLDAVNELKRLNELQAAANLTTKVAINRALKIEELEKVTIPFLYENRNQLHLSESYRSYIDQWVKEQIYDRKKQFTSKYTEKGNLCENDAIEFAAEQLGWGMVLKNDQHFEDDHITGTPDILLSKSVEDIKCVWSCFSFPLLDNNEPNKAYEWQGIGYMALSKREQFGLRYCLMDAPESLIEAEARKLSFKAGYDEVDAEFYDQVKASMSYSHLPPSLRLKSYLYGSNNIAVLSIRERVELGRTYIKSLNLEKYI